MDIRNLLDTRLASCHFNTEFDQKTNILRYINPTTGAGVSLDLNTLSARFTAEPTATADEIAYYVEQSLRATESDNLQSLTGNEHRIYPVIRSTSFPKQSGQARFITKAHTAETMVYYALDLGSSYRLIDEALLQASGHSMDTLHQKALSNLRAIIFTDRKDEVAGNNFYFVNVNDGYDASRVLLTAYLDKMHEKLQGEMVVAIPHQDVLIIGDICNEQGYDILAQMNMQFFTQGNIPITSMQFLYQDGKLEPIFIMAKTRPTT